MKITKLILGIITAILLAGSVVGCSRNSVVSSSVVVEVKEDTSTQAKEITADNKQFSMKINYGLNGVLAGNSWFPVNVTLQNKGKDFVGSAKIILPSNRESIAYEKAFSIASGTEKTVSITIPEIGTFGKFRVEIAGENGEAVFSKDIQTGLNENTYEKQLPIGILSEDNTALNYFNSQVLSISTSPVVKMVKLDEETLPDDASVLGTLSYLMINQFTTEKLSQEQLQAIIDWTAQGGTLILGTGASAEKVLSGFPEGYLGGTIGRTTQAQIRISGNKSKETARVSCANLSVDQGEMVKEIIEGANIFKVKKEKGSVIIADFDLGSQEIGIWDKRDQFAAALLEKTLTETTKSEIKKQYVVNDYLNNMIDALSFYRGIKIPKLSFYILLFTAYILIIGPIGYFLLKKKDKREWLWIFVPAVALCFNGTIFLFSASSRIHNPVATTITVIDSTENIWQEKVYTSLLNPSGKSYDVEIAEECQKLSPLEYNYFYNQDEINLDQNRYTIEERSDGTKIKFAKEEAFNKDTLSMEWTGDKKTNGFEKKLNLYMDRITGEITNQTGYDLTEVRLVYNGMYVNLGGMKNKETKKINAKDIHKLTQFYAYDMGADLVSNMEQNTVKQRVKYQQIRSLYTFFCGELESMQTGDGYLFGVVNQYEQDYIKNSEIEELGKALIYESFKQMPKDAEKYYIRNITEEAKLDNTGNVSEDGSMLYSDTAEITYYFSENVKIKKVFADRVSADEKVPENYLSVWAWNYTTKKYEPVFKDTASLTEKQIKHYIKDQQMKLKFESQYGSVQLPIISVTGG